VGDTVTFTLVIANGGPSTATNIDVADVVPSGYTYTAASITGGDASDDSNPATSGLTWTINSLASGASVNLTYQANVLSSGTYDNYAEVTDHDQTDSDSIPGNSSTNEDDDDTQTVIPAAVLIADPAISKSGNPTQASVGEIVTFTLTVTNQGNSPAPGVVITDTLPAQFNVTAVNVSGAPFGTSVNVTPLIGTGPAPYTVVVTLGGDLGVTDVVVIDIVTTVNSLGNPPINNTASLVSSSDTDVASNNTDSVNITTQAPRLNLPDTGFAPGVVTALPNQPQELNYAPTDLVLEIPRIGVKMNIVGVPVTRNGWDVSWLGNQAGWLEGSAFPSWSGNSVLTGHVYDAKGQPGPLVNLGRLRYGDSVIVHAYGQTYIFEIRTNDVVTPRDSSVFKHEERPWITLMTCKEYDEITDTYGKRVVVRAVLVSVTR
jgi:LPXTG-site transpeptidase (sortase) family protein